MTALAANRDTPQRYGRILRYPVKGSTTIYQGSLCVLDAGYAKPGVTATGLECIGRAKAKYDNSAGADGALFGEFEANTVFGWANGDSCTQADVGSMAFVTDDQTVSKDSTGKSPAGNIVDVAPIDGTTTSLVWVETPISLPSVTGYAATGATASSATPAAIGDPAAGSGTSFSRDDHVHAITALPVAYQHPGDAAASTTLAEHVFHFAAGKSILISSIKIEADAAVTADNTNNATITVKQGDGAGGARSTVATLVTNVAGGSWVAFTAKDMGAITNATVPASGIITVTIAKGGTGVQLGQFRLSVNATTDV